MHARHLGVAQSPLGRLLLPMAVPLVKPPCCCCGAGQRCCRCCLAALDSFLCANSCWQHDAALRTCKAQCLDAHMAGWWCTQRCYLGMVSMQVRMVVLTVSGLAAEGVCGYGFWGPG